MKGLWKVLKWVLLAGVLLIIAAVFLVATLDPNDHKEWIASKVKEETGRDIDLRGDISVTYYPWLGVEINGLTLANAPGFGPEPFLEFDHFKARIKLVPLLRQQYEIDTVELYGAKVNLARNKEAVTNWADLVKGEQADEGQPPPLTAIVLGGLDVRDARLTWTDATTGTEYRLTEVNARTGALTYGKPIDLAVTMKAASNKPALEGDAKVDGTLAYDLDNEIYRIQPLTMKGNVRGQRVPGGSTDLDLSAVVETNLATDTATLSDLKLSVLDMVVEGQVQASRIESDSPAVETTLKARGQDLSLLFKILEVEPLASQLAELKDRSFDMNTKVVADMERGDVNLSPLSLNLLGARINGDLKATNVRSEAPGVRGTLNAAGPDFPAVMGVLGQFQGGEKSPFTRISRQAAKAATRDFDIKADFDADMKSGEVKVPTFQANLLGAKVQARVTGRNMHTDKPHVQGSLEASGQDLPLLMRAAGAFQGDKDTPLRLYGRQLGEMADKSFAVKAEFDADMKSGNINVPQLSVKGLGIDLGGNLKAGNAQGADGDVSGRLTLSGTKMGDLLKALQQPDLAEVVKAVKLEAGISGRRSDLVLKPLQISATVAGKEVGPKPVDVALKADTRVNLEAEQLTLEGLSLTGLDLNVQGDISASKFMSAPAFTGRLDVAPFNLRKLMRQLNQEPPDTADKKVLRNVALKTRFAGSQQHVDLQDLNLTLDDTRLQGNFSFKNPEQPVVRFGIGVDQIDLDRYLPPEQQKALEGKPVSPETAAAAAATELPVELLRKLDVQGNVEIGKLVFSKARLSNVKLVITGKEGQIKMDPVTAQLYKGNYNGNIGLNAQAKVPKLTINSKLQNVEAEPLLKDMTGKAKLRGQGDVSMALVAAGADTATMKKTLNGQMSFIFRNGAIKGFNLGKMLRSVKSLKSEGTLKVAEEEETDFTEMTGNPVVQQGIVRLDDLDAKSPLFRIGGKGVLADLPRDRIDYTATATVVATSKGQGGKDLAQLDGITIPIRIKGSLADPKISPDLGGVAASFATNEAKKAILDKLGVPQQQPQQEGTQQDLQSKEKDPAKQLLDKALKDIFQ